MSARSRVCHRSRSHSLEKYGPTHSCYQRNGREGTAYLFHRYSFLFAFQASDVRFPTGAGKVLATEWAHLDLITKVIVRGKYGQLNTIYVTHEVYLGNIERTFHGNWIAMVYLETINRTFYGDWIARL